jgi:hypothetical protein
MAIVSFFAYLIMLLQLNKLYTGELTDEFWRTWKAAGFTLTACVRVDIWTQDLAKWKQDYQPLHCDFRFVSSTNSSNRITRITGSSYATLYAVNSCELWAARICL